MLYGAMATRESSEHIRHGIPEILAAWDEFAFVARLINLTLEEITRAEKNPDAIHTLSSLHMKLLQRLDEVPIIASWQANTDEIFHAQILCGTGKTD